jgi:hypothetical protein
MPVDIYEVANTDLGRKKRHGALPFLYLGSHMWDKLSFNNHYIEENMAPLTYLLSGLKKYNYDFLDLNDFAKFSVFISLTNSIHYDNFHNWILSYDTYMERFSTITRDPMGWMYGNSFNKNIDPDKLPIEIITSSLFEPLFRNYNFLYLRQQVFQDFFLNKEKDFLSILDDEIQSLHSKLDGTNYNIDFFKSIKNNSELHQQIEYFRKQIIERFSHIKDVTLKQNTPFIYSQIERGLTLQIEGRSIADRIFIKQDKNFNKNTKTYIAYLLNDNKKKIDVSNSAKIDNNQITINIPLLANVQITSPENLFNKTAPIEHLVYHPATYDIIFENTNLSSITSVQVQLLDMTNSIVDVKKTEIIQKISMKNVYNVISKRDQQETWQGTKIFSGFTTIKKDIKIMPGTTIKLDDQAVLKFLGKVTAIGTQKYPITFTSIKQDTPWSSIVIKDEQANGSVLEHCLFENGSGSKGNMYEYTGMLSIHNAKNVFIKDSIFRDNHITDDMVHIVYSTVDFINTTFLNANADALDVDISEVKITHCNFKLSGNDAVDLMTSKAFIKDSYFTESSDKGISVGENSLLLAINNKFVKNNIGIQCKDASTSMLNNCLFDSNKHAIDAFKKNWRYDLDEKVYVSKSIFSKNEKMLSAKNRSEIKIYDSFLDNTINKPNKKISFTKCDSSSKKIPKDIQKSPYTASEAFITQYEDYRRDDIRGTF